MSSAAAALHSDHVNLLIFRYLQEAGFENAALALTNDWHRPKECSDPECYPFAHEVRRNELVSVIQEGLHHDALQARVRKSQRKYRWTGIDARESIERQDGRTENGAGPRAASSNKRKGRPAVMRPPDFLMPAPKRQRRSEGSEAHLNGDRDAMDVDAASADAEGEDDPDAASPTVHSEPEQNEVMDRYDSMDLSTQTEIKTGPNPSTMYWKLEKPGASIMYGSWCPSSHSEDVHLLLVGGRSICRYYSVPEIIDNARQVESVDDDFVPDDSDVTATSWRPDGEAAAYAVEYMRKEPDDEEHAVQMIIEHGGEPGSRHTSFIMGASLIGPYGMVLFLCYSPDSRYLLAGRTQEGCALIQVWKTRQSDVDVATPIAWKLFDREALNAAWISNNTFIACGKEGLSCMYQVDEAHEEVSANIVDQLSAIPENTMTVPSDIQGLISLNAKIFDFHYDIDNIVLDKRHGIGAFGSMASNKLVFTPRIYDRAAKEESDLEFNIPEGLSSLQIAPWKELEDSKAAVLDAEKPTLLAAAFQDGYCIIYEITKSDDGLPKCEEVVKLMLQDAPAIAVKWSPNGEHVAVANEELVQIWSVESFQPKNGVRNAPEPTVVWRPAAEADETLGESIGDDDRPQSEVSLSWSADGESLAFAADKQIAIIRFRPSLQSDGQDTEQNGRPSP